FHSFYLELVWVHDLKEAQHALVRPTRLWERWSMRQTGACPFGVVLRGGCDASTARVPFPMWDYAPPYLPNGLVIGVALDTPLTEPEFFYLGFQRQRARLGQEPVVHGIPTKDLTDVTIGMPALEPSSEAARIVERHGLLSFDLSREYILRLTFDEASAKSTADLRPELPLVLDW